MSTQLISAVAVATLYLAGSRAWAVLLLTVTWSMSDAAMTSLTDSALLGLVGGKKGAYGQVSSASACPRVLPCVLTYVYVYVSLPMCSAMCLYHVHVLIPMCLMACGRAHLCARCAASARSDTPRRSSSPASSSRVRHQTHD